MLWRIATGVYTGLLFLILNIAPSLWERFDAFLNGGGIHFLHLGGVAGFLFSAVFLYRQEKIRDAGSIIKTAFFFSMFVLFGMTAKHAPEKIHLLMYFVLGLFIYRSLITLMRSTLRVYLTIAVLCLIVGVADEAVQYVLPSRVFDVRDIIFNAAGGLLSVFFLKSIWNGGTRGSGVRRHMQ